MSEATDSKQLDSSELASQDRPRSEFIRNLIGRTVTICAGDEFEIPRTIVQFWSDETEIPTDVQACLDSWIGIEQLGVDRLLFNDRSAREFIVDHLGEPYVRAFDKCRHPAMHSDFFRLAFILIRGGIYVDADDEYVGGDLAVLLRSRALKVQPLCYQISSDSMRSPLEAAGKSSDDLIFYVNNNPIIAPAAHPIVRAALEQATQRLLRSGGSDRDIQTMTGPGNFTESLVRHALELLRTERPEDFALVPNWDSVAQSKWPLDYRSDQRNWRNWVRLPDEASGSEVPV